MMVAEFRPLWDDESTPLVIGRWEVVKVIEVRELHAHRTPDDRRAGKWYVSDALGSRPVQGRKFFEAETLEQCYRAIGVGYNASPVKIKTNFGSITAPLEYFLTH